MKKKIVKLPITGKKKIKPLPNNSIPLGGSPFVGRSTTG